MDSQESGDESTEGAIVMGVESMLSEGLPEETEGLENVKAMLAGENEEMGLRGLPWMRSRETLEDIRLAGYARRC